MANFNLEPRLKSREEISLLFLKGKSIVEYPIKIIFIVEPESKGTMLLFSVPKRKIKSAVTRNLAKRRMKEAFRKNKTILTEFTEANNAGIKLGFIYLTSLVEPYPLIEEKIIIILQRLNKLSKTA